MPNFRASPDFFSPAAARAQLLRLFGGERGLAAGVHAALLGQGDSFALAFEDEGSLELGGRAHHREQPGGYRSVLAGEGQALFDDLHRYALAGQRPDEGGAT
ncbi:hypothetical protein [Streptomyces rochei]